MIFNSELEKILGSEKNSIRQNTFFKLVTIIGFHEENQPIPYY